MRDLLKYYKSGFLFTSETEFGEFIRHCLKISEKYLCFMISKGKLFIPYDMNPKDAAVDLLADIFPRDNNRLTKFNDFFSSLNTVPETNEEVDNFLHGFIIKIIQRNLINIFSRSDRETYNIMNSINKIINKEEYFVTYLLGDKYVHRVEVDFSVKNNLTLDDLFNMFSLNIRLFRFKTYKEFLENIFNIVDSQNDFNKAVAFNDMVVFYKSIAVSNHYREVKTNEIEAGLHYKIMLESVEVKFYEKLNSYFCKKKFSEKEQECLYMVVDEFIKDLIQCGIRRSPSELTKRYFNELGYDKYINKVEYCIQTLINDLINEIKETEKIG